MSNPGPSIRKGIVRQSEDWHCVLYHAWVVAAYTVAFVLWLHPEWSGIHTTLDKVAFLLAAVPLLGWISGINIGVNYHNHIHRPLFHSAALNRWFERLWTPFGGWPARYWAHYHVGVHHKRLMSDGDWTVRLKMPNGEYEGCLRYQLRVWPWRSLRNFPGEIRRGDFDARTAAVELLLFLPIYSVPFLIDPVMGLCLWLAPTGLPTAQPWAAACSSSTPVARAGLTTNPSRTPWTSRPPSST